MSSHIGTCKSGGVVGNYLYGVELEYSFPKKNNYVKLGFFLSTPPPLSGYFTSSILVPQLLPSKTKPSSLSATDDGRPC